MFNHNISLMKISEGLSRHRSFQWLSAMMLSMFILLVISRMDVAEGCYRSNYDKCRLGDVKGIGADLTMIKNSLYQIQQYLNRIKKENVDER